jgi:gluconokinase
MASATGLFNQKSERWDEKLCAICGIRLEQLPELFRAADHPEKRAPELQQARIFPAIGDGAASNLGSDAVTHGIAAISVGTSAAVRMVQPQGPGAPLPFGLFRYAVDGKRQVVGGAMSNGGNLRQWCVRELHLEGGQALGRVAAARSSLTVLPFWVEERAPTWPDTRGGIIAGLTQATTSADLYRAITTSVFNRVAEILSLLESHTGRVRRIILSGGIVRSAASVRLLADVLGRDVEICREMEASLRGAALHALEQIGSTPLPLPRGRIVKYDAGFTRQHRARRARQVALEKSLGAAECLQHDCS